MEVELNLNYSSTDFVSNLSDVNTTSMSALKSSKWTSAEIARLIQVIIRPILIIIGTTGNFVTFYIMRRSSLKNVSSCFYMSILALADSSKFDTSLLHHFHFTVRWLYWWGLHTSPQTNTFHIVSWYIQKVLFLYQMLSHLVSVDVYQYRTSSCFVFDFPKLNSCQHVFTPNFFTCACEYILFLQPTYVDKYYFHSFWYCWLI